MRIEEIRPSQIPQDWYDELIGIDLETEDKYLWSPICMCSLYKPKSGVIYVVPIKVYRNGVLEQLFKQDDNEFRTFIDFISRARIVGHNLQFDCAMIQYQWGVKPKEIVWDTYLVARVLQLNTASLKDLILQIKPEMVKIVRHFKDIQYDPPFRYDIDDVTVLRYSALDAYFPFVVLESCKNMIRENYSAIKVEQDFLYTAIDQRVNGLGFDMEKFNEVSEKYRGYVEEKNNELDNIVGWHVRCNASADKSALLYDRYNCDVLRKTKGGAPSTANPVLELLLQHEYREEVKDIIRRIIDINSSFAVYNSSKKAPQFVRDGRLYFSVEQIGYDATARVYTKDMSVNSLSKTMREAIVPSEGKKFLYFDYKAAELYIAMILSGCTRGIEWYNSGKDLHTEVMKEILHAETVTKKDREISKVLSFSQIYGGGAGTIARDLDCSMNQASSYARAYEELFPEIVYLRDCCQSEAHRTGYTTTIIGRRRYLNNLNSYDSEDVAKAERQVFNTKIQSSCSDLLKIGCRRCMEEFSSLGVRVAFTVFDSYLLEVPKDMTVEEYKPIMERMSDFTDIKQGLKLRYDYAEGTNWKMCQDNT